MGDEAPDPGNSTRQGRFLSEAHSVGGFPVVLIIGERQVQDRDGEERAGTERRCIIIGRDHGHRIDARPLVKAWRPGEAAGVGVDGRAGGGVNQLEGEWIVIQVGGKNGEAEWIGFADRVAGQRRHGRRDVAGPIAQDKVGLIEATGDGRRHAIAADDIIRID